MPHTPEAHTRFSPPHFIPAASPVHTYPTLGKYLLPPLEQQTRLAAVLTSDIAQVPPIPQSLRVVHATSAKTVRKYATRMKHAAEKRFMMMIFYVVVVLLLT
jgi:hypothetical protein